MMKSVTFCRDDRWFSNEKQLQYCQALNGCVICWCARLSSFFIVCQTKCDILGWCFLTLLSKYCQTMPFCSIRLHSLYVHQYSLLVLWFVWKLSFWHDAWHYLLCAIRARRYVWCSLFITSSIVWFKLMGCISNLSCNISRLPLHNIRILPVYPRANKWYWTNMKCAKFDNKSSPLISHCPGCFATQYSIHYSFIWRVMLDIYCSIKHLVTFA